ncbi:MAG: FkbM family methyltransferase [Acidobacteria bacterium]|nr:FkbM family methyltransferase [Acidobacteriota bacterium]
MSTRTLGGRLASFFRKPAAERRTALRGHAWVFWRRMFPDMPLPIRLSRGIWWLSEDDLPGQTLYFSGAYKDEEAERRFVERYLQPGMTVLDIGAHHGFYTLLASRIVGGSGQVIAFEPSPRDFARLRLHLRLNFCRNARAEALALAGENGAAQFYVVEKGDTGRNGLRRAEVYAESVREVTVREIRLDDYLDGARIERTDLVKLDAEGAELSILQGAERLLGRAPRPAMLCELRESCTRPWGYTARQVHDLVAVRGFQWFTAKADGRLAAAGVQDEFDGNFVAVPQERQDALRNDGLIE